LGSDDETRSIAGAIATVRKPDRHVIDRCPFAGTPCAPASGSRRIRWTLQHTQVSVAKYPHIATLQSNSDLQCCNPSRFRPGRLPAQHPSQKRLRSYRDPRLERMERAKRRQHGPPPHASLSPRFGNAVLEWHLDEPVVAERGVNLGSVPCANADPAKRAGQGPRHGKHAALGLTVGRRDRAGPDREPCGDADVAPCRHADARARVQRGEKWLVGDEDFRRDKRVWQRTWVQWVRRQDRLWHRHGNRRH
jgi:hypothetical protein